MRAPPAMPSEAPSGVATGCGVGHAHEPSGARSVATSASCPAERASHPPTVHRLAAPVGWATPPAPAPSVSSACSVGVVAAVTSLHATPVVPTTTSGRSVAMASDRVTDASPPARDAADAGRWSVEPSTVDVSRTTSRSPPPTVSSIVGMRRIPGSGTAAAARLGAASARKPGTTIAVATTTTMTPMMTPESLSTEPTPATTTSATTRSCSSGQRS